MPWKESTAVNERMKFIYRLEDGEKMTDLCREFNISRKTGYKIYNRYKDSGLLALYDNKRGPRRAANRTPDYIQSLILKKKKVNPTWGAPKIREWLVRKYPSEIIPVKSTVHCILDKNGLVKKKRRKNSFKAIPTNLSVPSKANDLWCIDYKGQFRLRNRKYCYPLTLTDQVSRYLLACEGFSSIRSLDSQVVCEELFREYGLPNAIRSDNGEPFSSRSIWGLSSLSIWWLRLGIKLERINPGHPEQNGQHERMHRTLKADATKPTGLNLLHQQEIFNKFKDEFNLERPHEALKMKTPNDIYKKSNRCYPDSLPEPDYSGCDLTKTVTKCGSVNIHNKDKLFVSTAFRGQPLGLTEHDGNIWQLDFMDYTLGFFDKDHRRLTLSDSPFDINLGSVT